MAEPGLSAVFGQPFAHQVAAWQLRLSELRPTQAWTDVEPQFHDRGFMVAGANKAQLLADLADAVGKGIEGGGTLEQFRKDFRRIVAERGWHGWTGEGTKRGEAWRTRTIWRTNMATTYAAGRRAQLIEGGFRFWIYRHGASREPRLIHLGWDGLVLPPEHAFWSTHSPPNGWGCSCFVVGARSERIARRMGGDPGKKLPANWRQLNPKTGTPAGIDKGWAYAPGASVAEAVLTLKDRLPTLPAPLGARVFEAWPESKTEVLAREFVAFVQRALSEPVQGRFMVVGALQPAWVAVAQSHGLRPETAEIVVTDRNVRHTFRGTGLVTAASTKIRPTGQQPKADPLALDWYLDLPFHLREPKAVLLDLVDGEPVFLLIYDTGDRRAKLVVEVDTWIKKAKGRLNTVQSGRLINRHDLLSDIARGVVVIAGEV